MISRKRWTEWMLRSRLFNGRLANPEAEHLRNQLRDLYYFNEAWIPELKKSGIGRVQLYDLSKDLGQQNDIAKERPELVARLKKQAAAIHRSVMAEAPEWLTPEEQAASEEAPRKRTATACHRSTRDRYREAPCSHRQE